MDGAQELPERRNGWAYAASALLHIAVALVLFLKLPEHSAEPPKDEAVKVDIVQEKEAPPPPEQKPPEEKKPEEKAAEKPPAPPPPPPPEAKEEAKVEPPESPPIPQLRPVFQFGQKDEASQKQAGSASDGEKDAADELADQKPAAPPAEEPKAVTEEAAKEPQKDDIPGVPDVLKTQEQQASAAAAAAGKPAEEKAAAPKPEEARELKKARKLYSANDMGGRAAIVTMSGLSRPERIKQLCATELGQQLIHGSPPYQAEIVPSAAPREGNVLSIPKAYFRTRNAWYEISFQCELDADATRVVSFAFKVGAPVPKSEWRARGFPTN